MPIATLTRRGRITLPVAVRMALGLAAGAKIDFVAEGDGFRVVPVSNSLASLKGRFTGRVATPVSVEEMEMASGASPMPDPA